MRPLLSLRPAFALGSLFLMLTVASNLAASGSSSRREQEAAKCAHGSGQLCEQSETSTCIRWDEQADCVEWQTDMVSKYYCKDGDSGPDTGC